MNSRLLVTGGAGFIGSNFVHHCVHKCGVSVVNLDKLTYAGNLGNLSDLEGSSAHTFVQGDINDFELVQSLLKQHCPVAIVHFAAESHVDRSILAPDIFIKTNINGTFTLLRAAVEYWNQLDGDDKKRFRFIHVSTDEVYGSLGKADPAFTETNQYAPNSPYSASKAASDHLVRSYFHTYGLPVITTNCSNNYGPYQFPEKLIPLVILNALSGKPLPVYGDGMNVRDWLFVEDHCSAIMTVLGAGRPGETYNVGGCAEMTNLEVVTTICNILDEIKPNANSTPHSELITYVKDRPGHDRRYAMDISKIRAELGWSPQQSFATGIRRTIEWYLGNSAWIEAVVSGSYKDWVKTQYAGRSRA